MSTLAKTLSLISALFMLTACGGGGDSSVTRDNSDSGSGGGGSSSPSYSIALTLENESGESDNNLSENNSLVIVATVTDQDGNPHSDALLTFTLSNQDLAEFGNDTGTARTNSDGVARLGLEASTASGDGEITAALGTGETGTTTFSATGSTTVREEPASLELYANSIQLASSGSDEVELIALVKNEQSVLMEGIEVSFSAASGDGVELQLTQPETAADGTARAILTSQNNASNRTVTITAGAGGLTQTVEITIAGTEVTINGASSVILNDSVDYTIRVQDSDGTSILNQNVKCRNKLYCASSARRI